MVHCQHTALFFKGYWPLAERCQKVRQMYICAAWHGNCQTLLFHSCMHVHARAHTHTHTYPCRRIPAIRDPVLQQRDRTREKLNSCESTLLCFPSCLDLSNQGTVLSAIPCHRPFPHSASASDYAWRLPVLQASPPPFPPILWQEWTAWNEWWF